MNMPLIRKLLQDAIKGGLTVRRLATLIGISRTSINDYLEGGTTPTPETVVKIARYFKIRPEVLFSDDDIIDITPEMKQLPAPEPSEEATYSTKEYIAALIKRIDGLEARINEWGTHIATFGNGLTELHKQCNETSAALREAGRTGDLAVLETLGDKG